MKGIARQPAFVRSALGAVLAVLGGLALWYLSFGEPWVNASYDSLCRFGSHSVTNRVVLILMDNAAFDQFHQIRGQAWDRALHAQLLNRLADDGCPLVAMDSFFHDLRDSNPDTALATAMARQKNLVLMAEQSEVNESYVAGAEPILPASLFLTAARTNWGVAYLNPDTDDIVRHHWPFPAPGPYPSFPETIARLAGAKLSNDSQERWIRYYGEQGPWTRLSYGYALTEPKGYFHDAIVFIGTEPKTTLPGRDLEDKFSTPYTPITGAASGGVEIQIAEFLNLLNHDWLERPPIWAEGLVLILTGIVCGTVLSRFRPWWAVAVAAGFFVAVAAGGILLGQLSQHWFPWLVVAGGQVPVALASAIVLPRVFASKPADGKTKVIVKPPRTPGYTLIHPPFGEGAYGKVWLARTQDKQWRAIKVVYRANFGANADPYDREYDGIQRYLRISGKHSGLLRVDFLSEKKPDHFYYVMELGDATELHWNQTPTTYRPRDVFSDRTPADKKRLPMRECVRIGLALADALEYIHQNGLTHRDIKPQNVIFVDGQPKLADMGLVAEIRPHDQIKTYIGTPGYLPPPNEPAGTVAADIYALGMVLYVLQTGNQPSQFPDVSTTLVDAPDPTEFLPFNAIVLKACQPVLTDRYKTAAELRDVLKALLEKTQAG